MKSVENWYNQLIVNDPRPQPVAGFQVLLCRKPQLSITGGEYPWKKPPAQLRSIPLFKMTLKRVLNNFDIKGQFLKALEEQYTHMRTPDLSCQQKSTHSALFESSIENYPGNIALVYTRDPETKSSYGIFFGCSDDDIKAVEMMLQRSVKVYTDPLLLLAVFAELQTAHLRELGETLIDEAVIVDAEVKRLRNTQQRFQAPKLTKRVNDINADAKLFEEDIAAAHRHLKGLINQTDPKTYTGVFRKRFEEMSYEYDDLSGACRVAIGTAILNAQAHATDISKHEATSTTILAFVAMIYLPISTVAAIFAMPIFDFKAYWIDIQGRPVPTSPSSSDAQPVIVSYYVAYYIGVSFALLLLTLEGWYISTRGERIDRKQWWKTLLTTRLIMKLYQVVQRVAHRPSAHPPMSATPQPMEADGSLAGGPQKPMNPCRSDSETSRFDI
ncbi:hypothetical protein F4859DRAFT_9605 [Xylaria cf. heliscus]|nr:hypothetical protein F4859DRAFT_9605 [Xylaria cf. heliscus]